MQQIKKSVTDWKSVTSNNISFLTGFTNREPQHATKFAFNL